MSTVPIWRLYVMRAAYLFIAVGLALMIWTLLLFRVTPELEHMRGVVWALLGAVGLLAVIGIRYPLQMLPLLMFELVWKLIWLAAYGLPQWVAGQLTPVTADDLFNTLFGVAVMLVVIPWGYVWRRYVKQPAESWR